MRLLVAVYADYMEHYPLLNRKLHTGMGLAILHRITGIKAGEKMSQHTSMTSKSTQSTIWQPISAIGGAVILGIVLPMIKGCQERSLISQQPQAAPTMPTGDNAPEVASTKR